MSEKEKNKRREFLNHVCPAVAMAFLGVPAIQSCSSGDDDTDTGSGNNNGGNTGGNTDAGYTISGLSGSTATDGTSKVTTFTTGTGNIQFN